MAKEYSKHADTEEYWNMHKRCYNVEINGKEYVITPVNVGFQDGRINCHIWVDGKEYSAISINGRNVIFTLANGITV